MRTEERLGSPTAFDGDNNVAWRNAGHYWEPFAQFVADKLNELRQLPEDWDGEGAPRIEDQILQGAQKFAEGIHPYLRIEPDVTPLPNGSVQFEWHSGERTLEMEFESPTRVHYLKRDRLADWFEEDVFDSEEEPEQANCLLTWFTSDQ